MKIALIQPRITDNLTDNLKQVIDALDHCREKADLAVLPELWNTPFINSEILLHQDDGPTILRALQESCKKNGLWLIAGSIVWKEFSSNPSDPFSKNSIKSSSKNSDLSFRLRNRCFVINDKGEILTFADKLHLLEVHTQKHSYYESDVFEAGTSLCTFGTPWASCALCICFDVRFCELTRLLGENAQILFVPANFNANVGRKQWKSLLCARAIENEVFVIGVNPQAAQYENMSTYGHSLVVAPDGTIIQEMSADEQLSIIEIQPDRVQKIRARSPYWNLRRKDLYSLSSSITIEKPEVPKSEKKK
ncbi:carbon-nitrogen hydrolase family protein [Ileibacterium valens]|uniref:carbon-nitrogen hydrolase family protein n=1 Tax=Ileibacterium valens TaxID=1862668 RepID=UPI00272AC787|nr:nitrilase-related carbon-nitrogen hydrolase [Ileibacterium valens]